MTEDIDILKEPVLINTSNDVDLWGMAKGKVRLTNDVEVEIMYVPKLKYKLLSICDFNKNGYEAEYSAEVCEISFKGVVHLEARWHVDGYKLKTYAATETQKTNVSLTNGLIVNEEMVKSQPEDWHQVKQLQADEKNMWITAMTQELDRFEASDVWTETTLPQGKKAIGCRWKFKRKPISGTSDVKLRARLVAQGFGQSYPEEFDTTYAPVIQMPTVRAVFAMAAEMDMHITHVDVDSAFLYSDLEESIYMKSPPGPWEIRNLDRVYKLKKSVYGLKQAARDWHKRITNTITKMNFTSSKQDPCLFTRTDNSNITWILLHVDDILIASTSKNCTKEVIEGLSVEYSIKVLGEVQDYLGIHIERDKNRCLKISQTEKIQELVKNLKLNTQDQSKTPMRTDYLLEREKQQQKPLEDIKKYQSVVGSLLYIANNSRPDISFAVNALSRHNSAPTDYDWYGSIEVVKYLNATKQISLRFGNQNDNSENQAITYTDSDWGGDHRTSRSTSGSLHFYKSSLIHWNCSRQKTIALSSAEAECTSAIEASKEALWLSELYIELNNGNPYPVDIRCDNQSCIQLSQSFGLSKRVRHIQIKVNFLRELIDNGKITMNYCNTKKMLADILTKPLPSPKFHEICAKLGLS